MNGYEVVIAGAVSSLPRGRARGSSSQRYIPCLPLTPSVNPVFPTLSLSLSLSYVTDADFSRAVKSLPHVKADHGLHLRALAPVDRDESGARRTEGEEWQLRGPLTYIPCPGVVVSYREWSRQMSGESVTPALVHAGVGSCNVSQDCECRTRPATEGLSGPPDCGGREEGNGGGVAGQGRGCLPAWSV